MASILEPIDQSQPCLTIHYTYNERLDGLSWYEMAESGCTHPILVWNVGAWSLNCHHPRLKSRGVVTVIPDEFKSQPCTTIHHNHIETLEWLGFYELPGLVQSHSILVWNVVKKTSLLTFFREKVPFRFKIFPESCAKTYQCINNAWNSFAAEIIHHNCTKTPLTLGFKGKKAQKIRFFRFFYQKIPFR